MTDRCAELMPYADALKSWKRGYFALLMSLTNGNVSKAAKISGRNRTELYRALQAAGINQKEYRK